MRTCAFFSPSLDPVLDGGKGHEHAVVAPQVPTRRTVGQTVLDDQPHRPIDHPVGIRTARWGQLGQVGAKVPSCLPLSRFCSYVVLSRASGESIYAKRKPKSISTPSLTLIVFLTTLLILN